MTAFRSTVLSKVVSRVVTTLVVILLCSAATANDDLLATAKGRSVVFEVLVSTFKLNYWDLQHTDWDDWAARYREDALSARTRAEFDRVAQRMVASLADQHSHWVGLVHYTSQADTPPDRPHHLGLGFTHTYLPRLGVVVERVFPETPAAAAGLRRGDVITAVAGDDLQDTSSQRLAQAFRQGVQADRVQLEVVRKHARLRLEVTPAPIDFYAVMERVQGEMLDATTGYIYLPSFNTAHVADEFHTLLRVLQEAGAKALVLDLRSNLGGRVSELGLVLGAFLGESSWARAVSRDEVVWQGRYQLDGRGRAQGWLERADGSKFAPLALSVPAVHFTGPLAVLVDADNSSAGEIAPLVLQGLGRATVVGEPTLGNVETIRGFDLPDGSVVMVAVANIEGLDGRDFRGGVVPDVVVSSSIHELARGFDAPLAEALRHLKALPFTPGKIF